MGKQEHLDEDNDRAKDLEEKAKQIDLGKNLEQRADKKAPKPKEPREKKPSRGKVQADSGVQSHVPGEGLESAHSPASEQDDEKRGSRGKHKKKKDTKKDRKRQKKEKKREHDEDGEDSVDDEA